MLLPHNNLRRHIVKWLADWQPQKKWVDDMMVDANILVEECQRLLPYVTPAYNKIMSKPKARRYDRSFEDILKDQEIPALMLRLRDWLLSCPFVKSPFPLKFNPMTGDAEPTAKIRYGSLDSRGTPVPAMFFELTALQSNYRYWLGPNGMREGRVSELYTFVGVWGRPDNIVIPKGRSTAERYAYVTARNPVTWDSPV